jgi:hypothetical protein
MKTIRIKFTKINAFFLVSFVLLVLATSCKEKLHTPPDEGNNEQARAEMLNHIIPLKEAAVMYREYGTQRIKLAKDSLRKKYGPNFNDTRTVWLDLTTVKEYIKYVEERSKTAGVAPTGLEFYFAVYPKGSRGKQSDHQTFFIAPTEKNGARQSGYTLVNGKKVLLNTVLNKSTDLSTSGTTQKGGFFSSTMLQDDDGLLLNRTDLSPPGGNN